MAKVVTAAAAPAPAVEAPALIAVAREVPADGADRPRR